MLTKDCLMGIYYLAQKLEKGKVADNFLPIFFLGEKEQCVRRKPGGYLKVSKFGKFGNRMVLLSPVADLATRWQKMYY